MTSIACRGPVRFLLLAFLILWLLFLAYLLTDSEARSSFSKTPFDISSFSNEVLGKIRDVFNGTRFRHEPDKFPIIWRHRDPAFARIPPSEIIHVELTTSAVSLGGAIAAINSVHLNTRHAVRFHIFAPDDGDLIQHLSNWISETHLREIDFEIIPFNTSVVSPRLSSSPRARTELASPMNFARYFTPLILRERPGGDEIGRLVHLDDDVIVQGDIVNLWNQTMNHRYWAAFTNECMGHKHSLHSHLLSAFVNFNNPAVRKLKIPPATCAMNTGVYVVDLFYWMKHNITDQLEQWLTLNFVSKGDLFDHQREIGYSGPPMMLVFHDKYHEIDPLWHVHGLGEPSGERHSIHYLENAHLLHWSGVVKPWGRIDDAMGKTVWDTYFLPDPWQQFKVLRKAVSKSSRV